MTHLSAIAIADLARRAGFHGNELHHVVAAALVTSGGRPDYEHAIYPGPVAVYKGLYGVDLCEWPELVGVDLADPERATWAAYDLTGECSGLDWCPAVRSGAELRHLALARVASSQLPGPERVPSPIVQYGHALALDDQHADLGRLHNAIQDHASGRR